MAPLVDPGTDLEDERPTPVGSPSSAIDECMPLFPTSGVDLDVAHALLEVGVLPAMVTPIVDPAVGFPLTPAMYHVPPVSFDVVRGLGSVGGGSSCWSGSGESGSERDPVAPGFGSCFGSFVRTTPFFAGVTIRTECQSAIWFGSYGPEVAVECFAAVGGVRGFPSASGSPDTSSDGRGGGCPWVGCVFPGRGYRYGWGPPEDARLVSGGPL